MNKLQPSKNKEFDIRYTDATDVDTPIILSVLLQAYAEFWGNLNPRSGTFAESAETIAAKLTKGGAIKAVLHPAEVDGAKNGGMVVGAVIYEPRDTYMYFGRLAVLPTWRGRGIAKGLIAAVESKAQECGLSRVQIGVRLVLASHQDYYAALGYRPITYECHPGFTEPTSVTMEKDLLVDTRQ